MQKIHKLDRMLHLNDHYSVAKDMTSTMYVETDDRLLTHIDVYVDRLMDQHLVLLSICDTAQLYRACESQYVTPQAYQYHIHVTEWMMLTKHLPLEKY